MCVIYLFLETMLAPNMILRNSQALPTTNVIVGNYRVFGSGASSVSSYPLLTSGTLDKIQFSWMFYFKHKMYVMYGLHSNRLRSVKSCNQILSLQKIVSGRQLCGWICGYLISLSIFISQQCFKYWAYLPVTLGRATPLHCHSKWNALNFLFNVKKKLHAICC